MKTAFLTEMNWKGKVPTEHPNMRTEMAWMYALDADHFNIMNYSQISGYDWIMLILPKGGVGLNSEGIRLSNEPNKYSHLYSIPFVEDLKKRNGKVAYIQEGPTNYVNDFSILDQFNFYNTLAEVDIIFAHNNYDTTWYKGWFPEKKVTTIPTLMIEELVHSISPQPIDKAMIGGGMCRWYGGFQSYLIASEFNCPIYVHTSHCTQPGEEQIPDLNVLPRLTWIDWIKTLSTFKYAINLMPTLAAGTFSLNSAYLGIPCIGNIKLDTQRICFPDLSVEVEDVMKARNLARELFSNKEFYKHVSYYSKKSALDSSHMNREKWLDHMMNILQKI